MNSLNHPKVKPLTREIANDIGLEPSFIEFVFATSRPSYFQYRIEDPATGWTCFLPDNIDVAYPLWSTNADQTLVLISNGEVAFAKGWHDLADIEMLARSSQGVLAQLMNALVESELSQDDLEFAASSCGFRYLDQLLEFRGRDLQDGQSWNDAFNQFIAKIDEQSI